MMEKQIEDDFVAHAESLGCLVRKLVVLNKRGWPDRTIFCPHGVVLILEFKRPGGKPSRQQVQYIAELTARGFEAYVVDSTEEASQRLAKCLERPTAHSNDRGS